jgi:hypothetical protein
MLGVYGDTVADIMTEHLGGIKAINQSVLSGTSIIFHIFKEAYNAELTKRGLTGIPNKQVNAEILEVLRAKELLPIVRGPVSETYDQGVAMYSESMDDAAENEYGDAEYDMGDFGPKGQPKVRTLSYKRRGYDGPGAAGLVALTNIGDSLNTAETILEHDLLEIFDAFLIGVNQADAIKTANESFAKGNLDPNWNSLGAVLEAVESMSATAEKEYPGVLSNVFQAIIDTRGFPAGKDETLDTMIASMQLFNDAIKARQADFKSRGSVLFEQIVLDKEHAFEYNGITETIEAVKELLNKYDIENIDAVIKQTSNSITDIIGCMNG